MPLLDAALAFSLTMLVVATVVTQVVEIIQRVAGLRKKDLQKLLTDFCNTEVQPVLNRELARLTSTHPAAVTAVAPGVPTAGSQLRAALPAANSPCIHLSTKDLIEQLKRTAVGTELLTQLGDKAQTVFDEFGKRYEEIGDQATTAFRKNARGIGMAAATVLAFALNIDSINLLKSYISNPQLRESVIAQLPSIEKHVTELEKAKADPAPDVAQDKVDQLRSSIAQLKTDVTDLKSSTFPIGPSQHPYLLTLCQQPPTLTVGLMWFMGILLTGALAGLGSPFWFDVVRGLSQLTQRSKGGKTPLD